ASHNFPSADPRQLGNHGNSGIYDAFLSKLNPFGSAIIYSMYLGGSNNDYASDIALDGFGNIYLAGLTTSTDFPTANPFQPALGGTSDGFVTKISDAR